MPLIKKQINNKYDERKINPDLPLEFFSN